MSIYVSNSGVWTSVPQSANKIFANLGGTWQDATSVWVAEETTPGNYQWTKTWEVIALPSGVAVTLTQEFFSGGDVFASFTQATGGSAYPTEMQWYVNGSLEGSTYASAGTTQHSLSSLYTPQDLDEIEARMRYYSGAVQGSLGALSDVLQYIG